MCWIVWHEFLINLFITVKEPPSYCFDCALFVWIKSSKKVPSLACWPLEKRWPAPILLSCLQDLSVEREVCWSCLWIFLSSLSGKKFLMTKKRTVLCLHMMTWLGSVSVKKSKKKGMFTVYKSTLTLVIQFDWVCTIGAEKKLWQTLNANTAHAPF